MIDFASLLLLALAQDDPARLRAELKVSEAPSLVSALREGTPRKRALLLECLLDRHDVALAVIRAFGPEEEAIAAELARAAFLRARPAAEEPAAESDETLAQLTQGLGETPRIACSRSWLSLDALAYEARRADLLPFPILVDPGAESRRVDLPAGVLSAEEAILGTLERPGVILDEKETSEFGALPATPVNPFAPESGRMASTPFYACGTVRVGDRSLPSFLLLDGEPRIRGGDRAARWVSQWRGGTGTEAVRAAVALLVLRVDPFDAAVVEGLRGTDERARAAFAAVGEVPGRSASLLAADPPSFDAFLSRLSRASELSTRARRVVEALPARDAAGRDVDRLLLDALGRAPAASKARWLEALARRRASAAAEKFFEATRSDDAEMRGAGLDGLRACGDPRAKDRALALLAKEESASPLRAALRILSIETGGPEEAASLLEQATGTRRLVLLAILFRAKDPAVLASAVKAIAEHRSPAELAALGEECRTAVRERGSAALERAFAPAVASGGASALLVAARGGVVVASEREAAAAKLVAMAEGELESLALSAAAGLGTLSLPAEVLIPRIRDATRKLPSRIAAEIALGEWVSRLPRSARAAAADAVADALRGAEEPKESERRNRVRLAVEPLESRDPETAEKLAALSKALGELAKGERFQPPVQLRLVAGSIAQSFARAEPFPRPDDEP